MTSADEVLSSPAVLIGGASAGQQNGHNHLHHPLKLANSSQMPRPHIALVCNGAATAAAPPARPADDEDEEATESAPQVVVPVPPPPVLLAPPSADTTFLLPLEGLYECFSFLSTSEVATVSLCCRKWFCVVNKYYALLQGRQFTTLNFSKSKCAPPLPRTCHSMTLHSKNVLVVYGGMPNTATITGVKRELCRLDLDTRSWRPPFRNGIPGLTEHSACAYQPTNSLILFGGYYEGVGRTNAVYMIHNVTAEKDKDIVVEEYSPTSNAATSSQTSGPFPGSRSAHTAVMHDASDTMYIFGGWERVVPKNDLWTFHVPSRKWTMLHPDGTIGTPSARRAHVAFLLNNCMWVFSGCGRDGLMNDRNCDTNKVHRFDLTTKSWSTLPCIGDVPCPRSRGRGEVDPVTQHYYFLGGWDRTYYFNDLYEAMFVGAGGGTHLLWRQIEVDIPYGVVQHSVTLWKGLLVTSGGYKSSYLEDEEEEEENEEDEEEEEEEEEAEEEETHHSLGGEDGEHEDGDGEQEEAAAPNAAAGTSSGDDSSDSTSSSSDTEEEDAYGWVTNEVEVFPISRTLASLPPMRVPLNGMLNPTARYLVQQHHTQLQEPP